MAEPRMTPSRGSFLVPIVGLALALLASVVSLDLVASFKHVRVPTSLGGLTPALLAGDELGLWAVMLVTTWVGARFWAHEPFLRFVRFTGRGRDIVVGAVVGALGQLILVPALYLVVEAFVPRVRAEVSKPAEQLLGIGVSHDLALVIGIVVVGAPLVEELFFRGLTFGLFELRAWRWRGWLRSWVPVVGSALLFAIAHFEPVQFLGLFAFGIVLGVLRWRSGRLAPSIVAHASFNLVAVVALLGSGLVVR